MSIETVLAKVIVRPKNSVIKSKHVDSLFYNIRTGKVEAGSSWIKKEGCSWFSKLDDKFYVLNDDTMYIEFIDDVSNVKDGYCGTTEMLNEDLTFCGVRDEYHKVWEIVVDDFKKFFEERKKTKCSKSYLMGIEIISTYCSYAGDGDLYMHINSITKVTGDEQQKFVISRKEHLWYYCS